MCSISDVTRGSSSPGAVTWRAVHVCSKQEGGNVFYMLGRCDDNKDPQSHTRTSDCRGKYKIWRNSVVMEPIFNIFYPVNQFDIPSPRQSGSGIILS